MSKRIGAALAALLIALPVLAIVSTSPASAHTQTVRRCAYDPFAGNQCWNENVAHVHPPNHYSPPPDSRTRAEQEAERQRQEAERQRKAAEKAAREQAAREAAEKAAREQAAREAAENAAREAAEKAAREAAEAEAEETETEAEGNGGGTNDGTAQRPRRCDTHPPQAGCPQQGDGSGGGFDPVLIGSQATWSALTRMWNSMAEANGEAALAEAEIRGKSGEEINAWLLKQWDKLTPKQKDYAIGGFCTSLGLATAAAGTLLGAPFVGGAGGAVLGVSCGAELSDAERKRQSNQPDDSGDGSVDDSSDDDSSDDDNPPREGGTVAARPQPDPDPTPDSTPDPESDAGRLSIFDVLRARQDKEAGRMSHADYLKIVDRWDCQNGAKERCQ